MAKARPKKPDIRKLKDALTRALGKQDWDDALEAAEALREADPKDERALLKIAELNQKLDRKEQALEAFQALAEVYAADGRLPRAISITKIIVELDPGNEAIEKKLALLYSQRGLPAAAAEKTAAEDIAQITGKRPVREAGSEGSTSQPAHATPKEEDLPELEPIEPAPQAEARRPLAPAELADAGTLDLAIVEAGPEIPPVPKSPLFSDFALEELHAIMEKLVVLEHAPGETIVKQGDAGDSVFVIAAGSAHVRVQRADGSDVQVATLGEGAFFGEFGVFMDGKRHASVLAATDVELLELRQQDLAAVFEKHPRVKGVLATFYRERALDTALAVSRLFGHLSAEARRELAALCSEERIAKGTRVLTEGQEGPGLVLVKRGVFKVESNHADGSRVELAQLCCGDFFGEMSLLSGLPVTADVIALEDNELLRFGKKEILSICERHPEVKQALEEIRQKRIHESIDRLTDSGLV